MKTFILMFILGLGSVSYAQTSKSPASRPTSASAKPCGMSPEAREAIRGLITREDFRAADPTVANIQKSWQRYLDQARECRQKTGDTVAQLSGADDAAMLFSFEAKYFSALYQGGVAVAQEFSDQSLRNANDLDNLQQRYNMVQSRLAAIEPLYAGLKQVFEQPTPIRMTCRSGGVGQVGCDGEILSPRPLPILPLHVTCRSGGVGQFGCEGDLMP